MVLSHNLYTITSGLNFTPYSYPVRQLANFGKTEISLMETRFWYHEPLLNVLVLHVPPNHNTLSKFKHLSQEEGGSGAWWGVNKRDTNVTYLGRKFRRFSNSPSTPNRREGRKQLLEWRL